MSQSVAILQRDNKVITQAEWMSMNPSVRTMAVDIAKSIKEAHDKVAKAKKLAEDAPNIKGGFLGIGKQKKVNQALSEAQVITNEALYDLSELIQQSIKFTLRSVKTASDMQKALAYLALNGIRDANGRVETLSSECTESINTIVEHAQDFINQQEEIEYRQNELNGRIEDQEAKDKEQDKALRDLEKTLSRYSENIERQAQKLSDLEKIVFKNQTEEERNRKKVELIIEKNINSIEHLQEALFENQRVNEERIKKLETELHEVISLNRQIDEEERNRLKDEYRADMQKLKSTFIIMCSSIAVIAVTALILSIVR